MIFREVPKYNFIVELLIMALGTYLATTDYTIVTKDIDDIKTQNPTIHGMA